jgi:hypothetical protein
MAGSAPSRRSAALAVTTVTALLVLAACGSGSASPPATVATSTSTPAATGSGPADVYLAIVASAADPNALEERRSGIVAALTSERAIHVVLEQGACYPGIPARYGDRYILALWDAEEAPVRADLTAAGADAEWSGRATVTCLD